MSDEKEKVIVELRRSRLWWRRYSLLLEQWMRDKDPQDADEWILHANEQAHEWVRTNEG